MGSLLMLLNMYRIMVVCGDGYMERVVLVLSSKLWVYGDSVHCVP